MEVEKLALQLIKDIEKRVAPRAAVLESRIEKARAYLEMVTSPSMNTLAHLRRYFDGGYDDMPFHNPAATLRELFERRWRCEVFSSGYHNGDSCTPDEPHGGWRCEYRWIAPALTEDEAREMGLITDPGESSS